MSYLPHDAVVVRPGQDLAALVSSLPNNSRVYLGDGTHTLTANLSIVGKSGISIEGGSNALISCGAFQVVIGNSSDVTLQGFRVTGTATSIIDLGTAGAVTNIRILNLNVSKTGGLFGWGITVNGNATDLTVRGCSFSTNLSVGLECRGGAVLRLKYIGNYHQTALATIYMVEMNGSPSITDSIIATNTATNGAAFYDSGGGGCTSTNVIIQGNVIAASAGNLAVYIGLGSTAVRMIIEGNTFTSGQIFFQTGTDIVIRNNCISGTTSYAIDLISVNRFTVTGNKLTSIGGGGALDAIRIFECLDGVISANVIISAARYGIYFTGLAGTNSDIVVDGNQFRTNASADILFATVPALRIIVSNNQFYRNVSSSSIGAQAVATITDCVFRGNTFDLPASAAISISTGTRCNVQNNIVRAPVGNGFYFDACTYMTVNNNNIDSAGAAALSINNGTDFVIDGNRFTTSGAFNAIEFTNTCARVVVNGNRLVTVGGNGVNTANLDYSIIRSNKVLGCAVGVYIASGCDNNVIGGNEIQSPTSHGIHCLGEYCNIVGNKVLSAGGNGILIAEDNNLVGGNTCTGCTGDGIRVDGGGVAVINININGCYCAGNGSDGIELVDTDESLVQSCRCYNNTGYGINQDAASDQCLVSSCHVRGNGTGALNLLGTNLTQVNNKT